VTADNKVQQAKAFVEGRLHTAAGEKRCGCGPCAHWVAIAARRAGIRREQLEAALAPPARAERPQRRRPSPTGVRICDSATIRVRGRQAEHGEGLAALLDRLHRLQ